MPDTFIARGGQGHYFRDRRLGMAWIGSRLKCSHGAVIRAVLRVIEIGIDRIGSLSLSLRKLAHEACRLVEAYTIRPR